MSADPMASPPPPAAAPSRLTVCAMVHYHEIALKRRNRPHFTGRLVQNIQRSVSDLPVGRVFSLPGRLLVELEDEAAWPKLQERLSHVMGVANFSPARRVEPEMEALAAALLQALEGRRFSSFRIAARRAFKKFPLNSMEIDRVIGRRVQDATGARVNLREPELTVFIEILPRDAFFFFEKIKGPGGVPVGTGGTVAGLLSGGIDSPVAAYRMMKRGCRVLFIHFHSVPFLSRASQQKAKELVELLNRYQYQSRLLLVPFGEIQRQIMLGTPGP
ncbi:MAG: tRNA sulfurtransferase, partial [Acidobacteriota bacterium]